MSDLSEELRVVAVRVAEVCGVLLQHVEILWRASPAGEMWVVRVSLIQTRRKHYTHVRVRGCAVTLDVAAATAIELVTRGVAAGCYQIKKAKGRPRKSPRQTATAPDDGAELAAQR